MRKKFNFMILGFLIMTMGLSAERLDKEQISTIMKDQSYYCFQPHSSRDIEGSYIAYNENDTAELGIIIGREDIYEDITIVMTVAKEEEKYRILRIDIPDIKRIKDEEKRGRLSNLISEYEGLLINTSDSEDFAVDAVSGASRFVKKGHNTFNSLFRLLVEEMEGTPEGEKILLK